eukprot:m.19973 g.19973  ORF g.19973 m.19973 type:complete len:320 (-) comp8782_c1_seq2:1930-2889(-)
MSEANWCSTACSAAFSCSLYPASSSSFSSSSCSRSSSASFLRFSSRRSFGSGSLGACGGAVGCSFSVRARGTAKRGFRSKTVNSSTASSGKKPRLPPMFPSQMFPSLLRTEKVDRRRKAKDPSGAEKSLNARTIEMASVHDGFLHLRSPYAGRLHSNSSSSTSKKKMQEKDKLNLTKTRMMMMGEKRHHVAQTVSRNVLPQAKYQHPNLLPLRLRVVRPGLLGSRKLNLLSPQSENPLWSRQRTQTTHGVRLGHRRRPLPCTLRQRQRQHLTSDRRITHDNQPQRDLSLLLGRCFTVHTHPANHQSPLSPLEPASKLHC